MNQLLTFLSHTYLHISSLCLFMSEMIEWRVHHFTVNLTQHFWCEVSTDVLPRERIRGSILKYLCIRIDTLVLRVNDHPSYLSYAEGREENRGRRRAVKQWRNALLCHMVSSQVVCYSSTRVEGENELSVCERAIARDWARVKDWKSGRVEEWKVTKGTEIGPEVTLREVIKQAQAWVITAADFIE